MTREERDDDDNESAVRALNTALTQQALSLKDLHDDPLMTTSSSDIGGNGNIDQPASNQTDIMSMDHNIDDTGSDAPSDENGDQTSSLLGFDNTDIAPGGVPTMQSSDSSEASETASSSMAGLAILDDLQATSSSGIQGNLSEVATVERGNDPDIPIAAAFGNNTNIANDSVDDTGTSTDEDGMYEELERLRASEQLLRERLAKAEQAATAARVSSPFEKLSQAAAQVFAPDEPPTAMELRAVASGANLSEMGSCRHKGTGGYVEGAAGLAPIINPIVDRATKMDVGLVQQTMETMVTGFVEGCQGYLEEAQKRSANNDITAMTLFDAGQSSLSLFRQPDAGEARPSDEEDSVSEETSSEDDDAPGLLNMMDAYGLGGLMLLATGGGENSSEDTGAILAERAASAKRAKHPNDASKADNNESRSNDDSGRRKKDKNGMPRHIWVRGKQRKNSSQDTSGPKNVGNAGQRSALLSWLRNPLRRNIGAAVSDEENQSAQEQGHEVEAFYQAKHSMPFWERLQSREQHDEWKKKLSKEHWFGFQRLYWVVFMAIALIMFLFLGILLLIIFGGSSSSSGTSSGFEEPALFNTGPYNISIFPECSQTAIANNTSPQHQAFQWLTQDPFYQEYSDERKLQRFALATLFYATDGPNWAFASGILSQYDAEECLWFQTRSLRTPPAPCSALNGGFIETLSLENNNLKGSLPPEIFLLTNLKRISLDGNHLLSTIPEDGLSNMSRLEYFSIANTGVFGPIPPVFGSLPSLKRLDLSNNILSSSIPENLANLSTLVELHLQRNKLTGTLPPAFFSKLVNLKQLYLYENFLEGSIPTEIGELSSLQDLLLSNNRMNSTLPSELGSLTQLKQLWLDQNMFSGELPIQFGSLTELRQLNLYSNSLSGTIPRSLGRATSLEQVRLEGNLFTGSVPNRLCLAMADDDGNDAFRILAVDCEEVQCNCDCTCARPGLGW